jgi:hypothetical protein
VPGTIPHFGHQWQARLGATGYLAMGGEMIDATVVPAPKQRNTEKEKVAIKEGRIPEHCIRPVKAAG